MLNNERSISSREYFTSTFLSSQKEMLRSQDPNWLYELKITKESIVVIYLFTYFRNQASIAKKSFCIFRRQQVQFAPLKSPNSIVFNPQPHTTSWKNCNVQLLYFRALICNASFFKIEPISHVVRTT